MLMALKTWWEIFKWNFVFLFYDKAPKSWIAQNKHHCSVECQFVQKNLPSDGLVYVVKKNRHGQGGGKGHFMNVSNFLGGFFDLNNFCDAAEIGEEVDFGDGAYIVVAFADNMSGFGFTDILHMIRETEELNEWFEATR